MKTFLTQFETIGGVYAANLRKTMNIRTVDDFLEHSLEQIHQKTKIDMDRLEEWLEVFDLFRVPNITPRRAELLRFASINNVEELAHRQTIRVFYKLQEIDEKTYYIILQLPTFSEIDNWIYYAKLMVKRIKVGENIPIILLPMLNFENASGLKKFNIYTIEDFLNQEQNITGLRKKIGMSRKNYNDMKKIISLIQIDGIDLLTAKIMWKAGIESPQDILEQNKAELLQKLANCAELDSEKKGCPSELELADIIDQIKIESKEEK